jgi:hypothetical protein
LAIAGNHLLASDYDTLCRVDLPGLTMSTSKLLQPGVFPMDKNFIGDFSLDSDDSCIVARPFSGDVLRVSAGTFAPIAVAPIGDQPLSVCTVSPDTVLTRDWKTGAVGLGQFKPVA